MGNIFAKNEDEETKKRNHRESVPIDRKMFNHFLNKFEDDQSRAVGKAQLWHLTKKQEEKRLEEERKIFEEQQAKEAEEQRQREEAERLEREAREKREKREKGENREQREERR